MRVAPTVLLSPEEREQLMRRARRGGAVSTRARIALLAARGWQDLRIARELGVSRQTAARWRRRFLTGRVEGLADASRAWRPGTVTPETITAIVRATERSPLPYHRPSSTRGLARRFGVSHMTVRRVWDAYGLRPARVSPLPVRPDPITAEAPWDVAGLLLGGITAALVVTLHRVVGPSIPGGPVKGGASGEAPGPSGSALPAAGPGVSSFRSRDSRALLAFLATVESRAPRGPGLRAIIIGGPHRTDPALREWRLRHPRMRFEPVEGLAEWQRRASAELAALGGARARAHAGRVPGETALSLRRSIAAFLPGSATFQWTASRTELEAGESAYRLRYELAVTGHPGFYSPERRASSMARAPEELLERSARAVVRRYLRLRPKERITIESWSGTLDYANALSLEALRAGARPLILYQDEPTYWAAATEVPAQQLAQVGEHRRAALERSDAFVSFFGPSDRERFHALPSATRFRLGEYQDALYKAAARSGARVVQMAIGRVSEASARMYGVEREPWRRELLEATAVEPGVLRRRGAEIAKRLARGREVEIRHPNGTRLTVRLRQRAPVVSDGTVAPARRSGAWNLVTLPAGVVTVALDERSADGGFVSNVPSSTALSYAVGWYEGGRWEFRDGRLRRATYAQGQELFGPSYEAAGPGRDRPGAISIGLNDRIDRAPLLEDQGLGTVTLQIGRNDHLGGSTRADWWAWSMLRGASVTIDGAPVLRDGRLVI